MINILYLLAAIGLIIGLKLLNQQSTARLGNSISAIAMLIAIITTLLLTNIVSYQGIIIGLVIGSALGAIAAQTVKMTAMPQLVALLNGFGGLASLLVGVASYLLANALNTGLLLATSLAIMIGGITFAGSIIAFAKLATLLPGRPLAFWGQQIVNGLLVLSLIIAALFYIGQWPLLSPLGWLVIIAITALLLGLLLILPIGGADMPVVIALLNSYSGLAACAAGFALLNPMVIVAGALVGASGFMLTRIMCKAMNRSLANILFAQVGSLQPTADQPQGKAHPITADDAYYLLEAANKVLIVPGYGMAVAQAQHAVKELTDQLIANHTDVQFAIHPVAGRMPGHMNVLLAEANVPYDLLVTPDTINSTMETIDVCLVVGANDVVNPAANEQASSPLYGMPIIEVYRAKTVMILKRSLAPGFAGVQNALFYRSNTRMLFGDAKMRLAELTEQFR